MCLLQKKSKFYFLALDAILIIWFCPLTIYKFKSKSKSFFSWNNSCQLHLENRNDLRLVRFSFFYLSFFFFFFLFFLQPYLWHTEIPRLGVKSELWLRPTSEPQQHQIRAISASYTTAYSMPDP